MPVEMFVLEETAWLEADAATADVFDLVMELKDARAVEAYFSTLLLEKDFLEV